MQNLKRFNVCWNGLRSTFLILFFAFSVFSQDAADYKAYSKAYSHVVKSNWNEAVKQLRSFNLEFSKSNYVGTSSFWLSYSLAKKKDYYAAFQEYKAVFSNPSTPKELVERSKEERVKIALLLRDKNPRFKEFIDHGADYTDEMVVSLNKRVFYKDKIKKLNDAYQIDRNYLAKNETSLDNAEKKVIQLRLKDYADQISYYDNILLKVDDKINGFMHLLHIDPDNATKELNKIIGFYEHLNGTYYKLMAEISREKWDDALKTATHLMENTNNAMYFSHSQYWYSFITQQIAIRKNDISTLNALFLQFSDMSEQMQTDHLRFECKINRIMIAKYLAANDRKYKYFLESGADFKVEIRQVYEYLTYIQNPLYFNKVSQLFRFDELQISLQNAKVTKKALDGDYDSKFVEQINKFADNLMPYYGSYQIDLDKFGR